MNTTPKVCTWTQWEDWGPWDSDCGNTFNIEDGTPHDNGMNFCCYCGKTLKQIPWSDEDENK